MNNRFAHSSRGAALLAAGLMAWGQAGRANNIRAENARVSVRPEQAHAWADVQVDLRWDHSWRAGSNSWDAAWVFVKFRASPSNAWEHARLSGKSGDHAPASNSVIAAVPDGMGVFVYRAADCTGSVEYAGIRLRWNCGAQGSHFTAGAPGEVSVQAIEMVHVPAGAFDLGTGGKETAHFRRYLEGTRTSQPFRVASEAEIVVGRTNGALYYVSTNSLSGDPQGIVSNAYPKGCAAFYCMKFEISQGQYAGFLNRLTPAQAANRYPGQAGNMRYAIVCSNGRYYSAAAPDRACNFLSWPDLAAYAAWAGLRPMTELEFEKACRGFEKPVTNEYVWGSTNLVQLTGEVGTANSGTETAWPLTANACYGSHWSVQGPVRNGIFAVTHATREHAGAGCSGALELSGNTWEQCVTVGNKHGRSFRGTHGGGALSESGSATNADWPGQDGRGEVTGADGAGLRGGSWIDPAVLLRTSDRSFAAYAGSVRTNASPAKRPSRAKFLDKGNACGGRAVRSAP